MAMVDFSEVRLLCPLLEYLEREGWRWTTRLTGHRYRGPCPVHGSTGKLSRIFAAEGRLNRWYCHKCKTGGDVTDLYAALHQVTIYEAAVALCRLFGVPLPKLPGTVKRNGQHGASSL